MAAGTSSGPRTPNGDYRSRRNSKPRVGSVEGIETRMEIRAAHVPATSDKFRGGFKRPGSRNRRKVGR